ncbi:hypothetical protein SAE02_73480 [Skermanella aerolata]|uniref:Uncharacterized protein n=2 Tax=Skermanella aerolata TaxID=393310 RepID=A0A512E411_9PROT|nr:hypothetical protein SAE02_73480 [Skermanella aerolata]
MRAIRSLMNDFLPAFALLVASVVIGAVVMLTPRPDHAALIVFGPMTLVTEAVTRTVEAGWLPIASPRSFVIIARRHAGSEVRRPEGAFLLLDASGISGCFSLSSVEK